MLIGGLIVDTIAQRVLLRALGPTLVPFGVDNAVENPTLELHDGNGALLASNNDWREASNAGDISSTGLAPADDREPAVLFTVPAPANYTAIVRGLNETTGVALLEAYLLP